jgi:hypothetical protein
MLCLYERFPKAVCRNAECHCLSLSFMMSVIMLYVIIYDECHFIIMLNVIMFSVIMLNVIILSVITQSVAVLSIIILSIILLVVVMLSVIIVFVSIWRICYF